MKKLGLIGGLGPASTLDYYSLIIDGYRKLAATDAYPEFTVENVDMTAMLKFLSVGDYDGLTEFLRERVMRLKAAGADFAAIASNTPHIVYRRLREVSPLPVLSIVDAACAYAHASGIKKLLVLGTIFTMTSGLYADALPHYGVTPVLPSDEDKKLVHSCIFPKLEDGIVDEADKIMMLSLIDKYVKSEGIDGVLLGCTELPIMIKQADVPGVKVIDTTATHCDAIVKEMIK